MKGTDYPNWVAERAKCNMRLLLKDVQQLVKDATDAMNTESKKEGFRQGMFEYWLVAEQPLSFSVSHLLSRTSTNPVAICRFTYDPEKNSIVVCQSNPDHVYTIQTRWDAEHVACGVLIGRSLDYNDEEQAVRFLHADLWKVVQYILEPFFFPPSA